MLKGGLACSRFRLRTGDDMKKLLSVMLGLTLILGTVTTTFAQQDKGEEKKEEMKKKGKKKGKKKSAGDAPPPAA